MSKLAASILLAQALAFAPRIGAAEEEPRPREIAKNDAYAIAITGVQPCSACPDKLALGVEVTDAGRKQTVSAVVKEGFGENSPPTMRATIVGDRAVLIGEGLKGDRIVVLQLTPPVKEIFSTRCYHPAVSPDGARVIFESWQERYTPTSQTAVYSVVDASQDPPALTVLHPIANAIEQDPQPYIESVDNREILASPIAWAKDGTRAALLERIGDKNEFYVVVLLPGKDQKRHSISQRLPLRTLLKPGLKDIPDDLRFSADSLDWADPGHARARLAEAPYWKENPLTIAVPSASGAGVDVPGGQAARPLKVVLDPQKLDFGAIKKDALAHKDITVKNDEKEVLNIIRISSSCPCTSFGTIDRIIKPGSGGTIGVFPDTLNVTGKFHAVVTVLYSVGDDTGESTVTVDGTVEAE